MSITIGKLLLEILLLVVGFVLLVKGADFFVDGAASIAKRFGIPELVIGLTIVAMGTSAPEAAVSIAGAAKGNADISIGNVIGSNIMNICVILGLAATIITIAVAKSTVRIEMPFLIAVMAIFLVLGWDGAISRFDGVILWALFLVYLVYLFLMAKKNPADSGDKVKDLPLWKSLLFTVGGIAAIVIGSDVAVDAASIIAAAFGMS